MLQIPKAGSMSGFGYAMNQMQVNVDDESRAKRLVDAVYDRIKMMT
jgi:hypothetical protein